MKSTGTGIRQGSRGPRGTRARTPRVFGSSVAVFAFWLVISPSLAPADLALGAAVSLLLGWWSARFLWAGAAPALSPRQLLALARYLWVFSGQVFLAALHVARVVIDPRLPIQPRLVVCRTRLRHETSRIAFAHSVSLTPGTLTVDMIGGEFLVHCLDEASAAQLLSGALEARVAQVFEPGEQA